MNQQRIDRKLLLILVKYVWLLPILAGILIAAACLVPYIICVYHGQVNPFLPYISDAGTQLPAAGYFSQILDTIGVIIMVIFYIRYRQIDYFLITVTISNVEQTNNDDNNMEKQMTDGKMIDKKLLQRLHLRNIIALIASIVAGFCVISIGNFRASEYLTLHCISVLVMVIAHSILVIENIIISYHLNRLYKIENRPTSLIILMNIAHLAAIMLAISSIMSWKQNRPFIMDNESRFHWPPNTNGYWWHITSTVSEYIYFTDAMIMFFIFGRRFYQFHQWDRVLLP
ncbi:DNA damage-regulated autophagy modulator protein 2 [Dermatophagoides farinae]|uniref:DNA damage-regulated autophagy modulator protein 2 n=1 Tax=Dermatophagoides farinae TaxID=6954 RepID=UPI003F64172A